MKIKYFLGMMAGAWMLAACSNQDELLQQDELVAKQCVTVNAYVPEGAGSRLTFEDQGTNGLKVSWKESGESFSVMTATMAEPVTFTQTEGSEFAGPGGFTFTEGTDYYAYYPMLTQDMLGYEIWGDPLTTVSAKAIPFNFKNQTGQLDENMNLMYAKRSAEGDFQFQHMLAVMKFTLKGIEGELVDNVEISFAHESDLYYTFGTVDVTGENPEFTAEDASDMLISTENLTADKDGNYIVYAYLPPLTAGTKVSIVAYSENEEENKFMIWRDDFTINDNGIEAGKYYTAARTMDTDKEKNVQLNFTAGTVEELKAWIDAVSTYSGVNLTLNGDIDLTDAAKEYDNKGNGTDYSNWPNTLCISGTVDGGGHTISGLYMLSGRNAQAALFSQVEAGGVVKNLHLENAYIAGQDAGGIASENSGTISGCSVSGSVQTTIHSEIAGGIVSDNRSSGKVVGCYSNAAVGVCNAHVGGIVGGNKGAVTACYSTGSFFLTVEGDYCFAGGVVGQNSGTGIVTACYWNSTSATYGIYNNFNTENTQEATQVDGNIVTWGTAMEAMNTALPSDFGDWRYEASTNENEPLILDKSGNNDYVPV